MRGTAVASFAVLLTQCDWRSQIPQSQDQSTAAHLPLRLDHAGPPQQVRSEKGFEARFPCNQVRPMRGYEQ